MLLLSELDRPHEALDLYERSRRAVREAFGADPSALKRLAADLRAGRTLSLPPSHTTQQSSGAAPHRAHPHISNGAASRWRQDEEEAPETMLRHPR